MKVKVSKVRKTSSSFPKVAVIYHNDCNEDEHFPYKNLRHTIGCCIESKYGEYTEENIKRFEHELNLSDGCLDNLSGNFLISLKDLMAICSHSFDFPNLYIPSEVLHLLDKNVCERVCFIMLIDRTIEQSKFDDYLSLIPEIARLLNMSVSNVKLLSK